MCFAHTQTRRNTETATERDNRNETNVCVYIYIQMRTVTTVTPASDKAPTPAHTQRESGMETLPEALEHSAEQRQPPEDLHRTRLQRRQREEKSLVPVRQHFVLCKNMIPFTIPLPLFYSPTREALTTRYIMFIACPFQTGIRLDFLPNECMLPRISP